VAHQEVDVAMDAVQEPSHDASVYHTAEGQQQQYVDGNNVGEEAADYVEPMLDQKAPNEVSLASKGSRLSRTSKASKKRGGALSDHSAEGSMKILRQ